ncbi:MAG TPA: sigma-70 family RNA polymerase sigma factor [Pirellulales bacterium]|jgi:RNA polymerase sigma-70 factor (ECF subfamily)|nr:sigma-70 family RNA polymerase sigma factor [Pirellulales bacterium]
MATVAEEIDAATSLGQLVRAAQAGCSEAFGELSQRFERLVYGLALRRLGNHAEAQEIVQEVFLQALRKIGQLREPAAIAGWLRSIASRRIHNRLTRRGPVASAEPGVLEAAALEAKGDRGESPLEQALARERQSQVREGLDRLGSLDRRTLVAFYVEGQSLIEMSTAFESPVGTIKRRLHVARKRLARELEELASA